MQSQEHVNAAGQWTERVGELFPPEAADQKEATTRFLPEYIGPMMVLAQQVRAGQWFVAPFCRVGAPTTPQQLRRVDRAPSGASNGTTQQTRDGSWSGACEGQH